MSGLDRSLDQIMKDRPASEKGRRGRGRLPGRKAAAKSKAATTAVIAPAGGVQKKTKATKPIKTPSAPAAIGDSKISVSNLPEDVTESMIKEYFSTSVAPVKRVIVNYGPNGRSRGSATVFFGKPTAAQEAVRLDGTKVDGRAMRVEVLLSANSVPAPQAPKPLKDRVSQPKNAAKEKKKDAPKAATNGAAAGSKAGKKKAKSGRAGRPKPKTTEELDAEMQDYFGSGEAAPANGTAQPAATNGGDTGMDEVL
ncbi:uncharacterized protein MYCFIDRAFT_212424 [Pseudocercospora fijiensis CIRAD86]|uniref:RRM domain-containing protein n=1 Tax=Pseudocercospora fijiensis (strain CIRAD86) TaxID=383855 RepID=M3AM93_PSEFD|nr:uncharacterized protein MYCFIDRAFT_212424 [Pseudocercospora fijiensis CIRAD86]EME78582.1 hypothetical protein MYCFIDRAFT_212424 [Pseudocercospora fijiensis CIRAD86]